MSTPKDQQQQNPQERAARAKIVKAGSPEEQERDMAILNLILQEWPYNKIAKTLHIGLRTIRVAVRRLEQTYTIPSPDERRAAKWRDERFNASVRESMQSTAQKEDVKEKKRRGLAEHLEKPGNRERRSQAAKLAHQERMKNLESK